MVFSSLQRTLKILGKKVDVLTLDGINRYLKNRILGEAAPS
jgi:predicted nucleotidyltransferase